jgi:hypothetical protein
VEEQLKLMVGVFNNLKREDHWQGIRMQVVMRGPGRFLRWRKRTVATLDIELTAKGREQQVTGVDLPVM